MHQLIKTYRRSKYTSLIWPTKKETLTRDLSILIRNVETKSNDEWFNYITKQFWMIPLSWQKQKFIYFCENPRGFLGCGILIRFRFPRYLLFPSFLFIYFIYLHFYLTKKITPFKVDASCWIPVRQKLQYLFRFITYQICINKSN